MSRNIAILLATYQSEKFIKPLFQSILDQTCKGWTLYIHDDGSSDNTLQIIKDYADGRKIILLENEGKKLGPMRSFMWLLEHVQADYYLFCDHDDVWHPDKISKMLKRMEETEAKDGRLRPVLVFSDMSVVDSNLNVISHSFLAYSKLDKLARCSKWLSYVNYISGCVMMFNERAKQVSIKGYEVAVMHDSWIAQSVVAHGGSIEYIDEPLILYRQHSDNAIGTSHYNSSFCHRLVYIKTVIANNINYYAMQKQTTNVGILYFCYFKVYLFFLRARRNYRATDRIHN
jgi:glycosyltransferase involved in cell wall biosynthesis